MSACHARSIIVALSALVAAPVCAKSAPRLALDLRALEVPGEVSYHPNRWLTVRGVARLRNLALSRSALSSNVTNTPRLRSFSMMGDVRLFGGGFRVSLGVREDDNARLLRSHLDRSPTPTGSFAPIMSVGWTGQVGSGVAIGGDIGMTARRLHRWGSGIIATPLDMIARQDRTGYRPIAELSAAYRF